MTRPLPKFIDLFINHKKFRNWIIITLLTILSAIVRYSAVPDAPLIWHAYTFVIFATSLFLVWEIFRRIDRWVDEDGFEVVFVTQIKCIIPTQRRPHQINRFIVLVRLNQFTKCIERQIRNTR